MLFMADHAHFFSLLEVEGRNFTDVLRKGTQQHINDMVRIIEAGQADGTIREEDPTLMALGVVGSVGHFSHFHRTGRISVPLPELAAFVARYVVHSVASDDDAIRVALREASAAAPPERPTLRSRQAKQLDRTPPGWAKPGAPRRGAHETEFLHAGCNLGATVPRTKQSRPPHIRAGGPPRG